MTPDQHKEAAEKLVHAVKNNTNGAYDEWTSSGHALKEHGARADFVRRHAGLSATPTHDDLSAIHQHVGSSLQSHVNDIQAKNPGEHVVGAICIAED